MRILIVDDARANRLLLAKILTPWGSCAVAPNGRLAVDLFLAALDERRPYDLIWLEIMMPVMDGLHAIEAIREEEKRRGMATASRSKVVMTATFDDVKNATQAFNNQCDVYLTKPLSVDTIQKEVENLGFRTEASCHDRRERDSGEQWPCPHQAPLQIGAKTFSNYAAFSPGESRVIRRVQ